MDKGRFEELVRKHKFHQEELDKSESSAKAARDDVKSLREQYQKNVSNLLEATASEATIEVVFGQREKAIEKSEHLQRQETKIAELMCQMGAIELELKNV